MDLARLLIERDKLRKKYEKILFEKDGLSK
jgi:hypothetical protein